MFRKRVAVDLGTANTLVHVQGQGLVLNEPSVVAVDRNSRRVLAVGIPAKSYLGRTPQAIEVIRPLQDGVIADSDVAGELVRHLLQQVIGKRTLTRPYVLICVPPHISEVDRRSVTEAGLSAGAHEVELLEEPLAAAVGADLPVTDPVGSMVVDVGGGTTDVAVITLGSTASSDSIRFAGDAFTRLVRQHMQEAFNLLVGENMAERIKIQVGCLIPQPHVPAMEVSGKDSVTGAPRTLTVTPADLFPALSGPAATIFETVLNVLERTPPELGGDLVRSGILLTGGGALLRGLDTLLAEKTGLPVHLDPDPLTTIVRGAGKIVDNYDAYKDCLPFLPTRHTLLKA